MLRMAGFFNEPPTVPGANRIGSDALHRVFFRHPRLRHAGAGGIT